ncbi:MAG: 2-amino-4-hydroxy-6-hydroxymethyldihydropteridine diphosphokinase [Bosea sp.]|nr:2-amino-4-hydroxy-6-hydroxymethyldihydropteridine diphosphokinase [Bosea sp. (in: a-proteobacteria)]
MVEATLGLGSNLGDRAAMLRSAVAALSAADAVAVTAISPVYETPPWGPVPQGPYLNACVAVETSLPARALLDLCLAIERRHGRERAVRWGPRTLDIDILDYGGQHLDEPGLALPHPRLVERAFVLVPLADIAPGLVVEGRTVAAWRAAIDASGVAARPDISLTGPA